ncbi:MAG: ABC transporter ATP-binding protein [Chloroflexi bacterium]|jgi:lipooligosaccharide transport system ATP-binding protein|nr:ABC transporter ATP-binding protein [Chloroflexota bacterium]MBT4073866.1 ABC transporter ATP-binding protein [Chloroflexota bacterium]MBT4513534.1 ABC transporter ATP-binding protein [Chloroflexota bacterium]MBT5319878.1 ABC transporter ATP-binding protein [Chloroflexota bacterium]MBT6681757.1 ABC transporter ATP-binding protein [Chloroflexota bacterium]
MVRAAGLAKKFGDFSAVDGISFEVRPGETFGMLGPNGAGKTSTLRMMSGLSPVTSGELEIDGIDATTNPRSVRDVIGVVSQHDGLDPDISVRDNLTVYGFYFGLDRGMAGRRADEVLDFFGLRARGGDSVDDLSGGMRRRLTIARAFVSRPRLVILDEPTTGLDPSSRNRVWEQLAILKNSGVTVVMSTHYMEEASILCDRLIIMDEGHILASGTPDELIHEQAGAEVAQVRPEEGQRDSVQRQLKDSGYEISEIGAIFTVRGENGSRADLSGITGARVSYRAANLEDVFLSLTGKDLQDE